MGSRLPKPGWYVTSDPLVQTCMLDVGETVAQSPRRRGVGISSLAAAPCIAGSTRRTVQRIRIKFNIHRQNQRISTSPQASFCHAFKNQKAFFSAADGRTEDGPASRPRVIPNGSPIADQNSTPRVTLQHVSECWTKDCLIQRNGCSVSGGRSLPWTWVGRSS